MFSCICCQDEDSTILITRCESHACGKIPSNDEVQPDEVYTAHFGTQAPGSEPSFCTAVVMAAARVVAAISLTAHHWPCIVRSEDGASLDLLATLAAILTRVKSEAGEYALSLGTYTGNLELALAMSMPRDITRRGVHFESKAPKERSRDVLWHLLPDPAPPSLSGARFRPRRQRSSSSVSEEASCLRAWEDASSTDSTATSTTRSGTGV
ncbi:hypothetical protein AK812_SmicGene6509 [Symbiodinium microadriaticum]|uniref:Uncharacterized protein n=1 Tax=Symbiodinium microadriaticum TaxID=2951 RepID=A0A1Q9ER42_SYMMI|nr:hypothetical protein AK812_SmicGene6509 [Symbiodinium microadriaticum]